MTHLATTSLGSADARFDRLYRAYHQEVFAYCLRRANLSDAEDVTAEVFTVAWRRIDEVPTGESTLPWLYGVAHRVMANKWRSIRRHRRLLVRLGGFGPSQPELTDTVALRRLDEQELFEALARLRWRDQEVLRLASWEKLSHRHIAELLGCSQVAIGQRIARAKKRLAKELETPGPPLAPLQGEGGTIDSPQRSS